MKRENTAARPRKAVKQADVAVAGKMPKTVQLSIKTGVKAGSVRALRAPAFAQ